MPDNWSHEVITQENVPVTFAFCWTTCHIILKKDIYTKMNVLCEFTFKDAFSSVRG